jgi:hypothetical protein
VLIIDMVAVHDRSLARDSSNGRASRSIHKALDTKHRLSD